jgi:putative (di)nucleoside polyphosphate hydrolase
MGDLIDSDGFRANVGIVLMDDDGRLFMGRRSGGRGWQFPQGGMRRGETPEEALYRELHEEIGLTAADVRMVAQTANWLRYRLPRRYVRRDSLPLCIGQKQRWFLLRLARADAQFRFDLTGSPEFDRWRWVDYWQPVREVIYFKRPVYVRALQELAELVSPGAPPPYPAWWPSTGNRGARPRRRRAGAANSAAGRRTAGA